MDLRLKGKIVLVTDSASPTGYGRRIAFCLAGEELRLGPVVHAR